MRGLVRTTWITIAVVTLAAGCGRKRVPGLRGTPRSVVDQMFRLEKEGAKDAMQALGASPGTDRNVDLNLLAHGKFADSAAAVDFGAIGKRCAGDLWIAASKTERDNFEAALADSWVRNAPIEGASLMTARVMVTEAAGDGQGRAMVSVSIQGATGRNEQLTGIDFPMARYLGRWRVVGQILHYGDTVMDEANLCSPKIRLARDRAERRRGELTLADLSKVLTDESNGGVLPDR